MQQPYMQQPAYGAEQQAQQAQYYDWQYAGQDPNAYVEDPSAIAAAQDERIARLEMIVQQQHEDLTRLREQVDHVQSDAVAAIQLISKLKRDVSDLQTHDSDTKRAIDGVLAALGSMQASSLSTLTDTPASPARNGTVKVPRPTRASQKRQEANKRGYTAANSHRVTPTVTATTAPSPVTAEESSPAKTDAKRAGKAIPREAFSKKDEASDSNGVDIAARAVHSMPPEDATGRRHRKVQRDRPLVSLDENGRAVLLTSRPQGKPPSPNPEEKLLQEGEDPWQALMQNTTERTTIEFATVPGEKRHTSAAGEPGSTTSGGQPADLSMDMQTVVTTNPRAERMDRLLAHSASLEDFSVKFPHFMKSNIYPPEGFVQPSRADQLPQYSLRLSWVFGYRGHDPDSTHQLKMLESGELCYPAAAVAVAYDVARHKQRFFRVHNDDIKCLAVHPDGTRVATAQVSPRSDVPEERLPKIIVWDSEQMEPLFEIVNNPHEGEVRQVCFSPDGQFLASVGGEKDQYAVCVWNIGQVREHSYGRNKRIKVPLVVEEKNKRRVVQADFSPQGTLVSSGKQHIKLWMFEEDSDSKAKYKVISKTGHFGSLGMKDILCFCFGPDGKIYSGTAPVSKRDSPGGLMVWEYRARANSKATELKCVDHLDNAHDGRVLAVVSLPDKRAFASAGKDGRVCIRLFSDLQALHEIDLSAAQCMHTTPKARAMTIDKMGNTLYVATTSNEIIRVRIDTKSADIVMQGHYGKMEDKDEVWGLAVSPTGAQFATCACDRTVRIWDADLRTSLHAFKIPEKARGAEYSPDGRVLAVGLGSGEVALLETQTFKCLKWIKPSRIRNEMRENPQHELKFSPDGRFLAVARDLYIDIYNLKTFKRWWTCEGHSGSVIHFDWSEDSHFLQSTCNAYELLFWDVLEKHIVTHRKEHTVIKWKPLTCVLGWTCQSIWPRDSAGNDINALMQSNDRKLLVTADDFGDLRLFTYPACTKGPTILCKRYGAHSSHVTNVRWAADDRYVISTGGMDQMVMRWDVIEAPLQYN